MAVDGSIKLVNPITKEAEELILKHLQHLIATRTNLSLLRSKLAQCDAYVSREPNKNTPESKKLEITVPIVSPQVDTMVAFLAKLFLSSDSVFPVTTSPQFDPLADAINSIFQGFSRDWQWKRNLILCFKDAAKYNLMVAEATWAKVNVGTLQSKSQALASGANPKATQEVKKGFSLKHLDPYNAFWDVAVCPSQLATDGEFGGFFEVMNKIQLHRYLLSLENNNNYNSRLTEILSSPSDKRNFHVPNILSYAKTAGGAAVDWDVHFESVLNLGGGTQEAKEVCTVYMRIVPNDFKMRSVPQGGTPQIWKFVVVNYKFIVYAECRSNAHDYLPIVIGQPYESNLGGQQKALPEELAPLQDMASHLWAAEIASNRRAVANREVYNPHLVDSAHINNPNPAAKIPLRNAAVNQDLTRAVYPIPFNDPAAGTRTQLATGISSFADRLTGNNQVAGGQFVKGNKTDGQFQEVLNRSDARQTTLAILLEDQFFAVVRHILLYDFMQYQDDTSVYDQQTKTRIEFKSADVLQAEIEFVINDALSLSANSVDPQVMQVAMQSLSQSPELQAEYSQGKFFNHMMSLMGVKDLDQFLKIVAPMAGTPTGQPALDANGQPIAAPTGEVPPDPNAATSPIDEEAFRQQMASAVAPTGAI